MLPSKERECEMEDASVRFLLADCELPFALSLFAPISLRADMDTEAGKDLDLPLYVVAGITVPDACCCSAPAPPAEAAAADPVDAGGADVVAFGSEH